MLPDGVPDLVALDMLQSVAELGSLGRAATRHQLSQPAVSMRMSALERRVGLSLLRRDPSGTRLTPAGALFEAAGRRVLAEAEAMMATVDALRADASSLLRVAASLTVADHLLPSWIASVRRQMPDVALTLEVSNSARVVAAVVDGRVDIGFVEGLEEDLPGLETRVVRRDRLVVVVDSGHPWAHLRAPLAGEDLAATDLVVREQGSGTREILEAALAPWGGVRTRLELGSPAAILAAVARGDGPAVLSELVVAADVAEGRLVSVETELDLARAFRALWLADRPLSSLGRRLLAADGL